MGIGGDGETPKAFGSATIGAERQIPSLENVIRKRINVNLQHLLEHVGRYNPLGLEVVKCY